MTANSGLQLSVKTNEDDYTSEIEAIEGIDNEIEIGVKCSYFLEAVSKIKSNVFSMQIESGNNPIIIESDNFRHIIMPVTL